MFELLNNIFEWAVTNVAEPSLIILLIVCGTIGFAVHRLVKTIRLVYRESVDSHDKITKTTVSIDKSMKNMNVILSGLSDGITLLTLPNEVLLEPQASLVYSLLMEEMFHDLFDLYINTNAWINKKKLNRSSKSVKSQITKRVNSHSATQLKQLSSRLQQFKFGGFYLDRYVNSEFKLELSKVNGHVLTLLIEDQNGIKTFISDKKLLFNSDFNEYLRDFK